MVAHPESVELSRRGVVVSNELRAALGAGSFMLLCRVQSVWVEVKEVQMGRKVAAQDSTKQQLGRRLVDLGQERASRDGHRGRRFASRGVVLQNV